MTEQEEFEFRARAEQEATVAKDPSMLDVVGNAVVKGVAGVVNTPVDAWNLAKMAAGAIHPQIKDEVTMTPNYPLKGAEAVGLYDPAKEPATAAQRYVDTAIQTGIAAAASPAKGLAGLAKAAVSGVASGTLAQGTMELTGSELLKVATGVVSPIVFGGLRATQATKINSVEKATLKDVRDVGYMVQPSKVAPSALTNKLETVAGGAATRGELSIKNQSITDKLAARAIGLPDDQPITMTAIEGVRKELGKVYEEVSALKPGGELRHLKVSTIDTRSQVPGPLQGLEVKSSMERSMLPGPTTGVRVTERRGAVPEAQSIDTASGSININEIRDESGRLIGLKAASPAPLEGLKTQVTSRGQAVEGPLERIKVGVKELRGPDVPGGLERLQVGVQETRGGNPMQELKQARADATDYYRHYARSADPASLTKAKEATARAVAIENEFERLAAQSGKPELLEQFRAARAAYARTYVVENALNLADGHVSAAVIGRLFDQGSQLTGELKVIGKFAQAYPYLAREAAAVLPPGVSGTDASMAAVLAGMGTMAVGDVSGVLAGGLPLLRAPARYKVASEFYQSGLTEAPRLGPAVRGAMVGKTLFDYKDEVAR